MKKNGKKWRRLQKEKELRKAMITKVSVPFSKSRNKKRLCLHYSGRPGGIIVGHCYSLLTKKSEKECECCICKKVFPIEKITQMKQLVDYLSNKGCVTDVERIAKLSKGIEPVYYYKLSETETRIEEVISDNGLCLITPLWLDKK